MSTFSFVYQCMTHSPIWITHSFFKSKLLNSVDRLTTKSTKRSIKSSSQKLVNTLKKLFTIKLNLLRNDMNYFFNIISCTNVRLTNNNLTLSQVYTVK